jgi:hypothetical protein
MLTEEDKIERASRNRQEDKEMFEDINAMEIDSVGFKERPEEVRPEETPEETPEIISSTGDPIEPEEVEEPEIISSAGVENTDEDIAYLNELARQAASNRVSQVETEVQQPVAVTVPTDLVSMEELEAAFQSPEAMMKVLQNIYLRAVKDSTTNSVQQALLKLPTVSRQVVMQVVNQAELASRFYKDNSDLAPYKDFVQYTAMGVETEHPDWNHEAILKETATLVRKRIPALRAARAGQVAADRPALPGSQRSVRRQAATPAVSALERELSDMPEYGRVKRS